MRRTVGILPVFRPSSPYEVLLNSLNEAPCSASFLKQTHALIVTNGLASKSVLACRLINYYARLSSLTCARRVFDFLPRRTAHAHNYLLSAYVDRGRHQTALGLYNSMWREKEAFPDNVTFSIVFKACIASRSMLVGRMIHAHVMATGYDTDLHLATDILRFYLSCDCIHVAKQLFDLMPQRDVIVWTAMIDGFFHTGYQEEALGLFSEMRESGLVATSATWNVVLAGFARDDFFTGAFCQFNLMQADGVRPDKVSLCILLPLLARAAILKPGLEAHAYALRNGFELDLFVATALVDMYVKSGNLTSARHLFEIIESKDIGVWNAIIVGYGTHGYCLEVLQLFHQLNASGMMPNEITFTSVLSACSHAGLLAEGIQVFDMMVHKYGALASVLHYTCMVDMFGRAGLLEEALEFIKRMPMYPTKDIWGALLSACRIHSNPMIADIAAQNILQCNKLGEQAGYLVMMSNIYAEAGKWSAVARLRTHIRESDFNKRIGFSWIEIGNTVHTFVRADNSHEESEEINALLKNLEEVIFFCI